MIFYTLHNSTPNASATLAGLSPIDPARGVRVVKDVLRVGKWKAGQSDWHVTSETLLQLANDFAAMKAAGIASNLYWGSRPDGGPGGQHAVEAKNAIAPIDQLFVDGDTLYCSAYVTDEQLKLLSNPAHQVSVGVQPDWTAGDLKKYSLALLHVAIVDQPVVTGQGPFLTLANEPEEDSETMTPELKAALDTLTESHKTLTASMLTLSNEFVALKSATVAEKTNAAKTAWDGKLKDLFTAKKIDAAGVATYEGLGEKLGYNLAILAPLDGVLMLANDSGVQKHASKGPELTDEITAADLEEAKKQLAGKK